jgi:uncharacterized protein YbjQ (UPF0145 family)
LTHSVRVVELPSKEVYIDINDLIIEFLLKADSATNDHEKKVYRELSDRLSSMRDRAHKLGANHVHEQKF